MHNHFLALAALLAVLLGGCASLPPPGADFPRTSSAAFQYPEKTRLGREFEKRARDHPGKSGFRLLPVGVDGFLARAQMAKAAERTLDIQYYLFRTDDTGKLLADAILRAADRGVRVRMLIDDADASGRDPEVAVIAAHPNVEVRLFNPFAYRGEVGFLRYLEFAFNASRLNYRMHNKLYVVDNEIALVGGRNVGDEYFQASHEFEFGDYDVFAAGPVVRDLSASFDAYWNNAVAIPVEALGGRPAAVALDDYREILQDHRRRIAGSDYARRLATGEPLKGMISGRLPLVWAHAQAVYDSPQKARVENGEAPGRLLRKSVARVAAGVQSELLIVSPYVVPGDKGLRFIRKLRERGVRIRVLTNSLESTDVPLVHAGYMRYRLPLLEDGVEIYEVRQKLGRPRGSGGPLESGSSGRFSLHAKVFVFDRHRLFIGSMNLDRRSLRINTELGLIIDSPELARQVAARFDSIAQPANSYMPALRRDEAGGPPRLVWRTEEDGRTVELESEPSRNALRRIQADLLSLLPLDDEL